MPQKRCSIDNTNGLLMYNQLASPATTSLDTNGNLISKNIACGGILTTTTNVTGFSGIAMANLETIRLETRSSNSLTGVNSIQLGTPGAPSLSIGDNFCCVTNKLLVGPINSFQCGTY